MIIEFFGPPCSGKTFCSRILEKNLDNLLPSYEIIPKYANKILKLSPFEKISLKYFLLIKKKKTKYSLRKVEKIKSKQKKLIKNYFYISYKKICKKLFLMFKKSNPKFVNLYINEIKLSPKNQKIYYDWFIEHSAKYYLANKFLENKVIVFDEGFLQRIFSLLKLRENYDKKKLEFLKVINLPNYVIYLNNKPNKLYIRSKKRSQRNKNAFNYNSLAEVKSYQKLTNSVVKTLYKIQNDKK